MSDTKQKLISLVSALETEGSIDYFYTFIALRLYGTADCPSGKFAEICEMYEKHMKPRIEKQEPERLQQTDEERTAGEYRCNIARMLYDISNPAILNYIRIIVEDVAKEQESGVHMPDERKEAIAELLKEIDGIQNIAKIRFISSVVKSYKEKGGVEV